MSAVAVRSDVRRQTDCEELVQLLEFAKANRDAAPGEEATPFDLC